MIDPYELLGVTADSTLKEVKRAYYDMCLLLHPDRGGNPDDMAVLQTAYEAIVEHAKKIGDAPIDQHEVDKLILSYKEDQMQFPSFRDIFDECVFDTKEFNREFEAASTPNSNNNNNDDVYTYPASAPGGYGEWLSQHDETTPKTSMQLSKHLTTGHHGLYTLHGSCSKISNQDDYTVNIKPLIMGDCKAAFQKYEAEAEPINMNKSLDELIMERATIYDELVTSRVCT